MSNPNQPQKKGFRAYAERDNERKLGDNSTAEKPNQEQPAVNEAVKSPPAPGK